METLFGSMAYTCCLFGRPKMLAEPDAANRVAIDTAVKDLISTGGGCRWWMSLVYS